MLKSAPWSLASESSFPKAPFGVLVICSFARFLRSVEMLLSGVITSSLSILRVRICGHMRSPPIGGGLLP